MKIILTGSTGFIGSEILSQLLTHPSITSIISISRREPPASTSPPVTHSDKLKTVVLKDFTAWPSSLLDECAGAQACIWALGLASADVEKNRVVNLEYTIAGCRALFGMAKASEGGEKMRFVYTSGFLAERDQGRGLWVGGEVRRIRGEVENQLVALGKEYEAVGATYLVRPAFVLKKGMGSVIQAVMTAGGMVPSVRVEQLAAAMIHVAIEGGDRQVWENEDLVKMRREVLLEAK